MSTGKTIALSLQTFVSKVMPLLFSMLSRFVMAFLPRSKHTYDSYISYTFHVLRSLFNIFSLCQSPTQNPFWPLIPLRIKFEVPTVACEAREEIYLLIFQIQCSTPAVICPNSTTLTFLIFSPFPWTRQACSYLSTCTTRFLCLECLPSWSFYGWLFSVNLALSNSLAASG